VIGPTVLAVALVMAVPHPSPSPSPTVPDDCRRAVTSADHRGWTSKLDDRHYEIPRWAKAKHRRSVRCAASPAGRAAMRRQWARAKRRVPVPNAEVWIRIGLCEQPGPGRWGIHWSFGPATYEGGLGFYAGTWDSYKPRGYPSSAAYATWRQQMTTANRVMRAVGITAWGCA
jgi:hypothetical protein